MSLTKGKGKGKLSVYNCVKTNSNEFHVAINFSSKETYTYVLEKCFRKNTDKPLKNQNVLLGNKFLECDLKTRKSAIIFIFERR